MAFCENLKKARKSRQMSQAKVAALVPMNQSNYSKIESGSQEPSLNQLKRICDVLNISSDSLLDLSKEKEQSKREEAFMFKLTKLIQEYYEIPIKE